jgi:nucleoside phosphorylase
MDLSLPCVVFALRREAMFFRRAFSRQRNFADAPCLAENRTDGRRTALVLETGVGPAAIDVALAWLFTQSPVRPQYVLSAGFSGALRDGLRVGDLVFADRLFDFQGGEWATTWPNAACPVPRGRLVTVPRLVADPAEKSRLRERFRADAADMETAAVARRCVAAGVPFGCLRVISDDVDTALSPALLDVLAGSRVDPRRLAGAILRRPSLVGELLKLRNQTRWAAKVLTKALQDMLAQGGEM